MISPITIANKKLGYSKCSPDICFILLCDTQCESKIEKAYTDLEDGIKRQREYLKLLDGNCVWHLEKFNCHNNGLWLDVHFKRFEECDRALFAIIYSGKNQIDLIKHLLSQSQYLPRFKIAVIIDPCEKSAIKIIKKDLFKEFPKILTTIV